MCPIVQQLLNKHSVTNTAKEGRVEMGFVDLDNLMADGTRILLRYSKNFLKKVIKIELS